MRTQDDDYIEENLVSNTFVSLEIDGIFYIDEHLKPILVKGFHHIKQSELSFSFYDFDKYPNNINMLPNSTTKMGAPKAVGFINTQNGPAMYSATQIRDSDMRGDNRGFLIMVRLLGPEFVDTLSKYTLANVSYSPELTDRALSKLKTWQEKVTHYNVTPYTDVLLHDSNNMPVSVLRMSHSNGTMPSLVNEKSIIFIVIMSLFFYFVHRLVLVCIIEPVTRLAADIKLRDNIEKYDPIDERYTVKELAVVSKNVNQLMATVKQQNEILAQQVNTDQLTQIMNRRGLLNALETYKELYIRKEIGFILVMVDIDHFKQFNDSAGHLEGDIALIEVANTLNEQCKRRGDVCARYGGEEFTLIFSEMDEKSLNDKLNKIIQALQTLALAHPCSPTSKYITVSMGAVIVLPTDVVDISLSLNDVFRVADNGLYEAKSAGRNGFIIKHFSNGEKSVL
jgi:diguanylate cyclase (GGDEF)-like protein